MESVTVDEYCSLPDCKVLKEYSFTLNSASATYNTNKFYICQIIVSENKHYVYSRYGRIGEKGVPSSKEFPNKMVAVKEFVKRFKSKTGNVWDTPFIPQCGKYLLMEIVSPRIEVEEGGVVMDTPIEDVGVMKFMEKISDKSVLKSTMLQFNIDSEKLPLGKISSNQIQKAMGVLKKIEDILKASESGEKRYETLSLSSEFWTLIPYVHGRKKPPAIDTLESIKVYVEFLGILDNLEVTGKVVKTTSTPSSIYESLGMRMSSEIGEDERKMISDYVSFSHGHTHKYKLEVENIIKIEHADETIQPQANHKLLFHGTRTANFIGILKQGLRVPKQTQIVNGAALGFGIYFADSVSKSFNYTSTVTGENGFVLMCDVDLGQNPQYLKNALFDTGPPPDYSSRIAQGQFGFEDDLYTPNKKMVPTQNQSTFIYNEYAIFDASKYKLKYIVELKKAANF